MTYKLIHCCGWLSTQIEIPDFFFYQLLVNSEIGVGIVCKTNTKK